MKKKQLCTFLLSLSILLPGISLAQVIAAGSFHCLSLCSDNTVRSWGLNAKGQLGRGNFSSSSIPVQVNNLTNIQAIATGYSYSLFIKNDGTVWGCGFNNDGELGDGTSTNRPNPVQVGNLTGIAAAAGGVHHSLFVKSNGTVWTCGRGFYGELGTGTYSDWYFSPIQISSLSGIIAASCGPNHSLFVKNNGSALGCGYNLYGQLGTGTTLDRHTPTPVALTGIVAAAAGTNYSVFLKNDGTVWACGLNDYGQLGDGTTTNRTTPVQVSTLTGVIAVAVFENHSLFLKNDGTVWACGRNNYGQLGDGTTIDRPTPVQVNGLSGITAIDAGDQHSLFLKTDCSVWACGDNSDGQLGNGTFTGSSSLPLQVTGTCQVLNFLITANGPTAICAPGSVNLNATIASGYSYQWRLNGAPITGATSASYVAAAVGNYDCIVSGGCGSDTSNIIVVSINPLPPSGNVTPFGPIGLCTGGFVTLNAITGSGLTYQWRVNGNNISGATSVSYVATTTGVYDCVVSNTCGSTTLSPSGVIVNDPPAPVITAAGPTTFCAGSNVLININQCSNCTYMWRKNGVQVFSGTSYTATTSGNYDCVVSNWCSTATSNTITVTVNTTPTISISAAGPTTFCASSSVTLNANPSSGLTYQWRHNSVNIPGATSSSYVATATGTYTCVGSNGTCSATSNFINTSVVSSPPTGIIVAGGPTTFCSPGSVTLSASSGSGLSYQWLLNGGNITGATTFSYIATTAGNYNCIVTNVCGSTTSNSISVVVVTNPPTAVINATGPTAICYSGSVTLNANTGTGLTYQWRLNTSAIIGATSSSYAAAGPGNYDCMVSNSCGSTTSNIITVTVNTAPPAVITAAGPTTFCAPGSVTLNANTGSGLSYQWRMNGINISGEILSSYAATAGGNFDCVVSNACGSTASNVIPVVADVLPSSIVTAAGPVTFCSTGSVTLNVNTCTGCTYQWRQNFTNIALANTSSYVASAAGNYDCLVTNSCGTRTSNTITVTVEVSLIASITAVGPTTFCSPGSVTLNANTGTGLSYQWRLNGINISGATSPSYFATATGNYDCTVSNTCGSVASNIISVTVNTLPAAVITAAGSTSVCSPNTVTLNANTGSGLSYQWRLNGGNISGATAVTYNAAASGNYNCIVSNSCGSTTSNSIAVTVAAIPATPGSITGQATGVCSSTKTYSVSAVSGAASYTWTVPAGASVSSGQGTTLVNVVFIGSFGSGNISVVSTNTCGNSGSSSIAVTAIPAQPGNITGPASVCHNQNNVLYSFAAVPGATSYTWTVPAGAQIKNGQGTIQIRVRFGNSAGNITVRANNACGQSPVRTLVIAMPCREEISDSDWDVTLHPNPAKDKLIVTFMALFGNEKVKIFNAIGENVLQLEIRNQESEINLGSLPDGIYFTEIISGNQKKVLKFIKQE
jgi:alpha-tubulin suppressor-like RCC1 family protein